MIEYFRDRATGKVRPIQTVDWVSYAFWRDIPKEDKEAGVVAILTGDWVGVLLKDDKRAVRIHGIKFIAEPDNPLKYKDDYLNVKTVLPPGTEKLIDHSQLIKVEHDAYRLYRWIKVRDNRDIPIRPKPTAPPDEYEYLIYDKDLELPF